MAEPDALRGEVIVVRTALEEVQWAGHTPGESDTCCPICEEAAWTQQHHSHCTIGRALAHGAGKKESVALVAACKAAQAYRDAINGKIKNMEMLNTWERVLERLCTAIDDMQNS